MSLRNLFGTLRCSRKRRRENETFKEARKEILINLREVHQSVKLLPLTSLTNVHAARYNILCHDLTLRTDGGSSATTQTYFKPWPLEKLEQFPLDLDNLDTNSNVRSDEACFADLDKEKSRETTAESDPDGDESGLLLSSVFLCQFTYYARKTTEAGATLDDLSGWFGRSFNNTIIRERYMNMAMFTDPGSNPLASPPLRFEDAWYPHLPQGQELPHINLIVTHEAVCDNNILRSELLVLVGVMRTRLGRVALQDHVVAPYVGGRQSLAVRVSRIYASINATAPCSHNNVVRYTKVRKRVSRVKKAGVRLKTAFLWGLLSLSARAQVARGQLTAPDPDYHPSPRKNRRMGTVTSGNRGGSPAGGTPKADSPQVCRSPSTPATEFGWSLSEYKRCVFPKNKAWEDMRLTLSPFDRLAYDEWVALQKRPRVSPEAECENYKKPREPREIDTVGIPDDEDDGKSDSDSDNEEPVAPASASKGANVAADSAFTVSVNTLLLCLSSLIASVSGHVKHLTSKASRHADRSGSDPRFAATVSRTLFPKGKESCVTSPAVVRSSAPDYSKVRIPHGLFKVVSPFSEEAATDEDKLASELKVMEAWFRQAVARHQELKTARQERERKEEEERKRREE
ncbi:hypothetical protein M752DRAFT_294051 [Aspergillus phoenicis ATCC 13157]|uniref:Uncharacterized protein n=1 Tax=Aspergillus phoenicis ATCC 13157 TaxID=1353007 RepID=A0A370PIQ8_ASPPH|nr:hypothetical protein M752DRAFT_294051 [Aspergillus phoenicis ATCC 13157]